MNNIESILSQKLKALIEHGGSIIIEKGEYYVQCLAIKGDPGVLVEAVSHYNLKSLPGNLVKEFALLGYKPSEDLADGNYLKEYTSSFVQQNIKAIISDVGQIFDRLYTTGNNAGLQIEDHIDYPALIEARKQRDQELNRSTWYSLLVVGLVIAIISGSIYWYIYAKPGSPSDKTAISLDELDVIQTEEHKELEKYRPKTAVLTAMDLIRLSDCSDLSCIQLYMKNKQPDFVYAKKGEYASQLHGAVKDTAAKELHMPLSTFYVEVNPQASWKVVHTLHSKALADSLIHEFGELGFRFADKRYYADVKAEGSRYVSEKYPGKSLYITATFNPWPYKDLYLGGVSWPCWMFEVYNVPEQ